MSATLTESLDRRINEALDASTTIDPPTLATEMCPELSDYERDGLVFTGLVRRIENRIRDQRHKAFTPPVQSNRSSKWEGVAEAVQSGAFKILSAKVSVGGLQRAIGTLSVDECSVVASGYEASAAQYSDRAERFGKLAKAMKSKRAETVADLDHALIERIFHA